jgi:hypothetical protein
MTTPMPDDTRRVMRLGWSSPPVMSPPGAYMSICPAKEVWVSPYMEYLHHHPYQSRQQLIHALWQVGCRKEAQKAYWQGKLKRKERE